MHLLRLPVDEYVFNDLPSNRSFTISFVRRLKQPSVVSLQQRAVVMMVVVVEQVEEKMVPQAEEQVVRELLQMTTVTTHMDDDVPVVPCCFDCNWHVLGHRDNNRLLPDSKELKDSSNDRKLDKTMQSKTNYRKGSELIADGVSRETMQLISCSPASWLSSSLGLAADSFFVPQLLDRRKLLELLQLPPTITTTTSTDKAVLQRHIQTFPN